MEELGFRWRDIHEADVYEPVHRDMTTKITNMHYID
jgi:hypothetical protein